MLAQFDLFRHLTDPQFLWILLWVGLGALTLVLCVLLLTRWGYKQPIQKCTILSVWFHLLLLVYATSITIVAERHGPGNSVTINLSSSGPSSGSRSNETPSKIPDLLSTKSPLPSAPGYPPMAPAAPRPKSSAPQADIVPPRSDTAAKRQVDKPPPPKPAVARLTPPEPPSTLDIPAAASSAAPPATPSPPPVARLPAAAAPKRADTAPRVAAKSPAPPKTTPPKSAAPKPDAPPPQANLTKTPQPAPANAAPTDSLTPLAKPSVLADLPDPMADIPPLGAIAAPSAEPPMTEIPRPQIAPAEPLATSGVAALRPVDRGSVELRRPGEPAPIDATPELYRDRVAPDRDQVVAQHGGSTRTEAAVKKALRWLASAQEADGRWNPARHGAGRESQVLGHDRGGAGAKADTGITGLALLAMLGAGNTHRRGDYQPTVNRGLDFLIASQHPNGNLGGNAEPYAFMYCHGMAALALSEALAMTGDERLREPVRKAVAYTLYGQNRTTGGWRYRPGDTGDLSQMGWQLMALKSAELGGIPIPDEAKAGMVRFIQSASSGSHGGLASYRPGEQVSRTMTAEGLLCRQFLGMSRAHPAGDEAGDFLLGELPGAGERNLYYWYYGTLSMYQLQGDHWRKWNEALTRQLVDGQSADGDLAGSWEANDVWGGYGGRVYATSLSTLCLEVYYRYLPLYVEAAGNGQTRRK